MFGLVQQKTCNLQGLCHTIVPPDVKCAATTMAEKKSVAKAENDDNYMLSTI